jgi:predicted aspartyl protease
MSVNHVRRRLLAGCAGASLLALRSLARVAPAAEPRTEPPTEPLFAAPTTLDRVGRVLAPVRVDGQGPFRFIVDTGATVSALSPVLVARLGLEPGRAPVRMQGVTGTAVVPTARVARLEAGALRLHDLELPVVQPQVFAEADGILGVEGMRGNRLDIDFAADRVTISRSRGDAAPHGFMVVPVRRRRDRLLVVDARIGGVRGRAIIDTGAERTLGNRLLQQRLRLAARDAGAAQHPTRVYGATDAVQHGESARAPRIRLGDAVLENVLVTFADLHVFRFWGLQDTPALLLGMDLLGVVSRLVIDYRRSELQVLQRMR